ncbi:hypothetical protein H0H92_003004 [Tricholoma furcatifolium]|nr:hypothetical protein H0H92_003004 [Tricholoma furcatifolium]
MSGMSGMGGGMHGMSEADLQISLRSSAGVVVDSDSGVVEDDEGIQMDSRSRPPSTVFFGGIGAYTLYIAASYSITSHILSNGAFLASCRVALPRGRMEIGVSVSTLSTQYPTT